MLSTVITNPYCEYDRVEFADNVPKVEYNTYDVFESYMLTTKFFVGPPDWGFSTLFTK